MFTKNMKRKVAKVNAVRLSPNEEASILKQERERRRKLRLQQVREQEKFIAQQIRQDVKERRDQQLQLLAEDLRARWETTQAEKIQSLEKIYQCALNAIGEGHRQAKENEPDLKAVEKAMAANKEKAEKRHREALRELKQHKEKQLRAESWHIKARKKALEIEKERAAKIASLPPPPPDPLQNIEVEKRLPVVKVYNAESFSTSHYHLPEAYVDREIDTEQTDARSAAVEEEKRMNALQQEEERERLEQMEKANLRGSHALKQVQLAQDRERLMTELEHLQQEDLSRRRQIVAKMPQQLFEPAYRRAEIREEWQRELETAFEDMYTRNAKLRGDLVLHLKPQPLPDPSVTSLDEDLDLTVEPEVVSGAEHHPGGAEDIRSVEDVQEGEPQSKKVLKRLLNRIRNQKDQWRAKAETSEAVSDTLESGSLPMDQEEDKSVIDSNVMADNTVLAGKSILLHPQEQAVRIRAEAERKTKMEDLERQKQEQLELIHRLEEERKSLEAEFQKMRIQMQENSATTEQEEPEPRAVDGKAEESVSAVAQLNTSAENGHLLMIRQYQQRLIEQNRLHQQSVDEARRRLQEYQILLRNRYPHLSASNVKSPEKGEENVKTSHEPPLISAEYNPPSVNAVYSPGQPLSTEGQKSDPTMSRGPGETPQISPRRRKVESIPSPSGDVPAVDSFTPRPESPVSVDSSLFLRGRSPQGSLSRSPNDKARSPDPVLGLEKLSSISSPGEHDSSSGTSYLPLPPALSLGLPQADFNGPSSYTVPEVGRKDLVSIGDFSNVQEFRERLLSSAAEIRYQQDHLKEMQVQLDMQRESLLLKQRSQEQHLLHRQKELEEQMRRHRESLEELLGSTEPRQDAASDDLHKIPYCERYGFMSALLKALDDCGEDASSVTHSESSNGSLIRPIERDHKWRSSKPPVTKTKLGPFLQQHELSAIMEVETPSGSIRRSSTGVSEPRESQTGRTDRSEHGNLVSYHPDASKMSNESIHGDRSRLSCSLQDETPSQSRAKLSWRETLSLEGSRDPTVGDHLFTPVLQESLTSNRIAFPKSLLMEDGSPGLGLGGQGRSPNSACEYLSTTTISSGSFLTSEKTDSSPGSSDILSELQKCNYSAIEEHKDASSSPSLAAARIPLPSTWSDYLSPVETRSQIQQIIDKYTKDLGASLERNLSFRSPAVASDISATDHLSNTFHSLDPKPDFSISTPSHARSEDTSSPPNMPDLSHISSVTSRPDMESYRSPVSHLAHGTLALSSSFGLFHSQSMGGALPRRQNEADSSGSFLPLHPECTLNEPNRSGHEVSALEEVSSQQQALALYHGSSGSYDTSPGPSAGHRSSTILTSAAAAEESGSFHELAAAQVTANESALSEHPISESSKGAHFEELPAVEDDPCGEVNTGSEDTDMRSDHTDSLSPDQTPRSENMNPSSHSRSTLQSLSSLTIGSSAGSLPSFVRTWDSESMQGILEEPDLTLLSLNDSSVTCSEAPATLSSDHQEANTSQSTFQPLQAEVDASGLQGADQSSVDPSLSQNFAEISLEFTSTPGSLQEAFLRKKRHFIENSSKRLQEMKNKDRILKAPDVTDVSVLQGEPSSDLVCPDGGKLKKVVEVRVCTPEERKLSEIEMHQRTVRLYNQLDEVKTRREEKMRQETYAKNRQKAKEFKKRTLEKLRAKR
ncbi:hypothetical protein GDO81_004658 [Engystomops pustulosus]|uniref:ALMS motif domain-containing protein n=1 Tax=Engystomops pustulosus TaxID=76066 RepID=A0AAV7CHK3_ENGPU|nr:hypothetical protein GDO81_004658 [Engystomops pustulosus]